MRQVDRLSTRGHVSALAFVIVIFIFLINLSGSAAALPLQHGTIVNATNKAQTAPAAGLVRTASTQPHTQLAWQAQKDTAVTVRFEDKVGNHSKIATVDGLTLNQQYSWIKAVIKAFLVSVWTSIHTHAGGLAGFDGYCS